MATNTPNYNFILPEDGGDDDLWGDSMLNANWSALDAQLKALSDSVAANTLAAQIAIGDLYFSTDADDPATKLGYGTWEAYAAGRALVGVGQADTKNWGIGDVDGVDAHPLTQSELPSHSHTVNPPNTALNMNAVGNHTHSITGQIAFGNGSAVNSFPQTTVGDGFRQSCTTAAAGGHTPSGSVDIPQFNSGSVGSGTPHQNIQPSVAVYIWKRLT